MPSQLKGLKLIQHLALRAALTAQYPVTNAEGRPAGRILLRRGADAEARGGSRALACRHEGAQP